MRIAKRIRKVTARTVPVYLAIGALIYFADPTVPLFVAGLIPMLLGEAIRIWGTGHLEKNQSLATTGPYAYVQHPLYMGTLLIMIGACTMAGRIIGVIVLLLGIIAFWVYYAPKKQRVEGEKLLEIFGEEYQEYRDHVPAFFPNFRPYRKHEKRWSWRGTVGNSELPICAVIVVVAALIGARLLEWW